MHKRILIANRGVIAERIRKTAERLSIEAVVAYTLADQHTLAVQNSIDNNKICIGSGSVPESYGKIDVIANAARNKEVGAIHPGYGFLAESARFASMVQLNGWDFI